ncbi:Csn9 protein [Maudiozyma humilis]|uniref:Csn9 protein n=1 Tax=Maudiozyma humilis TaxID=51915 RepID=A0AAV5S2L1_MAUHU|nr:Csn9 protein [Kazachstania humilis]
MSVREAVIMKLEDPSRFHYKQDWLEVQDDELNMLFELFTFGTTRDVPNALILSPLMLKKLQLLTIVSLAQLERELTYSKIMETCLITSIDILERYMIELRNFFTVKLDPVRHVARITHLIDGRDVYCYEKPLLLGINPLHTKSELVTKLTQWQHKLNKQIKEPA